MDEESMSDRTIRRLKGFTEKLESGQPIECTRVTIINGRVIRERTTLDQFMNRESGKRDHWPEYTDN